MPDPIPTHEQQLEWLIWYLKQKNLMLRGVAMHDIPDLTTEEDFAELRTWPIKIIHQAYCEINRHLVKMIKSHTDEGDVKLCPWCIQHPGLCGDCGYGKRHGICGDANVFEDHKFIAPRFNVIAQALGYKDIADALKPYAKQLLILPNIKKEEAKSE